MAKEKTDKELKKPSIEEIMEVTRLLRTIADRHALGEISKDDINKLANKASLVPVD